MRHQGVPVVKGQFGRASVLEPKMVKEHLAPVKKGHLGDVQPSYMGVSLQHARFFKQLRRLQSLSRILAKGVATWSGRINRDETWRAIRMAAGFPGGFGEWWTSQGLEPKLSGPLPLLCPALDFAQGLFVGFQQFVQRYEQTLISQRYQHAKQRRAQGLSYVFQDCRDDPLPQADTLLDRLEVGVEEVRSEDNSLVLVRPVKLFEGLPVVVEGQVVEVVAQHDDQVWLSSVESFQPGHVLTQERAISSDADILARFANVWSERWNKHSHVQPGQWDQICGFLEKTARPIQWTSAPWTVSRFQLAVKHKKPKAAKGPDGVTQPDLAALPDAACEALLDIYRAVERGARWPLQMASGFVASLAKVPTAQCVDEFRPVVVYSLAYRIWSSECAREALHSVSTLLPASVHGGVPARQAKTIWYELASVMEDGLHGLLMDIQKCFNNIPRHPLCCALVLMGFPESVLRAWVAFVSGQSRRFKVRRSVGPPILSNCGLPEGCAMSVFGMTMIDWILDWWLSGLEVSVDLRTFVDDWGVMFRCAEDLPRIWASMEQFTGHLDLAIDMSKTRLWSTEATARCSFRSGSSVAVTLSARNLGAHQNFSRHCHNSCLQARLSRMPQVWIRLRASQGPYRFKVTAIHMMAWPKALHGISAVHLGACHFKTLRAGAVRALRADKKGSNPFLHLVTSALLTDPEAWSIVQTVRDVREFGSDQVEPLLGLFAGSGDRLPQNGPTAILCSRLLRLGWGIGGQGLVQDRLGTFSLMSIPWDELVLRIKLSWGSVLARELSHRPTFDGLENVDLYELYRALAVFGPADLVFLRCHLDGTLFTQNGRAKFQEGVTDKCPWCPEKDGFHHRAWICPHFTACRAHVTPDQQRALATLPPCLVDHGWPVLVPEWEVFAGMLLRSDGLCRMSPAEPPNGSDLQPLELFMDGTSAFPKEVKLRFASWALTLFSGVGVLDNQVLMGGHVSGLCQTAFRAELTAALHAIRWAVVHRKKVRLWCDCQSVVRGVNKALRRRRWKRNGPHSDLWEQLHAWVSGNEDLIQIRKVVSHGAIHRALDPLEQWVYWHNNLTDKAAEAINYRREPEFWAVWTQLRSALEFHRQLHSAILRVLLQTSKMAAAEQRPLRVTPQVVEGAQTVQVEQVAWDIPRSLVRRYGETNLQKLHEWWTAWGPTMMTGSTPLSHISGLQLFVSFNLHTGYQGPWCFKRRWYDKEEDVPAKGRQTWGNRCKPFLMLLRSYWKGNKILVPTKMARPTSTAVAKWVVCYRLRWDAAMVDKVDQALLTQQGRQTVNAADVARLHAARRG